MNIGTQAVPSVGVSFADLLHYNESEAMKWRSWLEAQSAELLDLPFGNPAKRMGNVREMIWHIVITEWVYASVLNGESYDAWDQFKRDSVAELFAIGDRARAGLRKYLANATDANMATSLTLSAAGFTISGSARKFLTHTFVHSLRHWAQLATVIAFAFVGHAEATQGSAKDQTLSGAIASKRMADGKEWMTANLNVNTSSSFCYDDAEPNCRRYGRLYTWESAQRGCQSLGDGWRLPTDDEWRQLAKHYGGLGNDSPDNGRAAYTALLSGGTSGFNAVLGGNRSIDGQYDRLEAHGIYWTVSENDPITAPLYNFGKGSQALYRGPQGQKQMAVSVRCVRE